VSVLVNGEVSSRISALDRGVMYGQCVFETIAISNGQACLLDAHLQRLKQGAQILKIEYDHEALISEISAFISDVSSGVLRINLTMGEGGRGYLNPAEQRSTRILSLHDYPIYPDSHTHEGVELGLVDIRLGHQPALAGIKHGNRLEQVIARSQWKSGWDEALVMDVNENVIEATQSNVFIVSGGVIMTPCLKNTGVAGVMRECILELFLTNSVIGLWPVKQFNQRAYSDLTLPNKLLKIIKKNEFIPTV